MHYKYLIIGMYTLGLSMICVFLQGQTIPDQPKAPWNYQIPDTLLDTLIWDGSSNNNNRDLTISFNSDNNNKRITVPPTETTAFMLETNVKISPTRELELFRLRDNNSSIYYFTLFYKDRTLGIDRLIDQSCYGDGSKQYRWISNDELIPITQVTELFMRIYFTAHYVWMEVRDPDDTSKYYIAQAFFGINACATDHLSEMLRGTNSSTKLFFPENSVWSNYTVKNTKLYALQEDSLINEIQSNFVQAQNIAPTISDSSLQVEVLVNGVSKHTYSSSTSDNTVINNVKMGDKVEFVVNTGDGGVSTPKIEGLPSVWTGLYGKEVIHYCDPSIQPGGFKPWIPFEVSVHYKPIREYPQGFEPRYTDWEKDDQTNKYSLSWTAQRRMDASKTKYQALYQFPKTKTFSGKTQRASQREGAMMELIRIWNENNNKQQYAGDKYLVEFDADEILYLNQKGSAAIEDYTMSAMLKSKTNMKNGQEFEPWQYISDEEGETLEWDATTGYPKKGFTLNEVITAYQRAREFSIGNFNYNDIPYFPGYEIEDSGMYSGTTPSGNNPAICGSGCQYVDNTTSDDNNKHPGIITVSVTNGGVTKQVQIKMNVAPKLAEDPGFYGVLSVSDPWPVPNSNVQVTLNGLPTGLAGDSTELAKYSIEVVNGKFQYVTYPNVKSAISDDYTVIDPGAPALATGRWTTMINVGSGSMAAINAYYQKDPNDPDSKVLLGGRELKLITPSFISAPGSKSTPNSSTTLPGLDLKEGTGDFVNAYLEDFRLASGGEFTEQKGKTPDGDDTYFRKYARSYTFQAGSNVTFSLMDAQNFIFPIYGNDFYNSFRAKAKGIPQSTLEQRLTYTLTDLNTGNTINTYTGRHFTYTYNTVGKYELRATYAGGDGTRSLAVLINVVDYGGNVVRDSTLRGTITFKQLNSSDAEYQLLELGNASLPNGQVWLMAEVTDVLSKWKYVDGPSASGVNRTQTLSGINRYSRFNDFNARFQWYRWDNTDFTSRFQLANDSQIENWIDNFDPLEELPDIWKDWVRHYSFGNLPPEIIADSIKTETAPFKAYFDNLFNKYFSMGYSQVPWQASFPWISVTPYDGYRVRQQVKSVIDLERFFDTANGVFSGNPGYLFTKNPNWSPQDRTDEQKDKTQLHLDLTSGKKIIFNGDTATSYPIIVYNLDINNNEYFIDTAVVSSSGSGGSRMAAQASIADAKLLADEKIKTFAAKIDLYPNPAQNQLTVVLPNAEAAFQIEVLDTRGRSHIQRLEADTFTMNVKDLPPGVYYVRINNKEFSIVKKVIIQ